MTSATPTTARRSVPGKAVELTGLSAVIDALTEAKERVKFYEQLCDDLEAPVKARMGDAEIGLIDGEPVVSYKSTVRSGLSQKLLKERFPLIALACTSNGVVSTFRLLGV
ncbi:hypothetical protein P3102_22485 [Amycolatopsis sp. QT-25]|uniref:hypothetical protein n=1 Tax=Amycolatopsis sp. QT-25 TaxID=3034022 RepID=UPI0023EB7653|nr:hypothetical protein [Amycolatopsis sp. QT-25]WET76874.1 hypothetical protein P3102_22485 [Amycolatopsis sp. QT-25]